MAVPDPVVSWIRENAVPFTTTEPGNGFTDLQPLKEMIGDARIVALGEATHGTHEFFAMKHRILEFLVEEMGFTAFAIEANWLLAEPIDDYVRTAEGDPEALLRGMGYLVWYTQEVLDLITWMREFTAERRQVRFLGFDVQVPAPVMDSVLNTARRLDGTLAAKLAAAYDPFRQCQRAFYERAYEDGQLPVPRGNHQSQLRAAHAELRAALEHGGKGLSNDEADRLQRCMGTIEIAEALFRAVIRELYPTAARRAWHRVRSRLPQSWRTFDGPIKRDRAMAEMVEWQLGRLGPDARIVLWAHNGHVMDLPWAMGSHLRRRFGTDLAIVAFAFHHGSFVSQPYSRGKPAGDPQPIEVDGPPKRGYEEAVALAGYPRFLLDLRRLPVDGPVSRWFRRSRRMWAIGAGFDPDDLSECQVKLSLPKAADILIYIEKSTPPARVGDEGCTRCGDSAGRATGDNAWAVGGG